MKKIISILLAMAMTISLLTACSTEIETETQSELETVANIFEYIFTVNDESIELKDIEFETSQNQVFETLGQEQSDFEIINIYNGGSVVTGYEKYIDVEGLLEYDGENTGVKLIYTFLENELYTINYRIYFDPLLYNADDIITVLQNQLTSYLPESNAEATYDSMWYQWYNSELTLSCSYSKNYNENLDCIYITSTHNIYNISY